MRGIFDWRKNRSARKEGLVGKTKEDLQRFEIQFVNNKESSDYRLGSETFSLEFYPSILYSE